MLKLPNEDHKLSEEENWKTYAIVNTSGKIRIKRKEGDYV